MHFTQSFHDFFKELAANNSKQWMDENRKSYEEHVKKPFKIFIEDLIVELRKNDPALLLEAKNAIFRINRDIRFSKDKTLYKLQSSAIISPEGRKNKTEPGMYLEFTPEHLRCYFGVYMPTTTQLKQIRETICKNPNTLNTFIQKKEFKKYFGELRGKENKRLSKPFSDRQQEIPLLLKKQYYFFHQMEPEYIDKKELFDTIVHLYNIAMPFTLFMRQAMN